MSDNSKVRDVLNKVKQLVKDKYFFEYQKKLDSYFYDLLRPSDNLGNKSFFLVLRRFNSFTPALPRGRKKIETVKGGGYFLYWNNKGIVIDPGFNYIENLYCQDLTIGDIDAILITHGHNDHYIDLDPTLTLLYQYNEIAENLMLGLKNFDEKPRLALDFFVNVLNILPSHRTALLGTRLCMHSSKLIDLGYEFDAQKEEFERESKKALEELEVMQKRKKIDLFLGRSAQKTVDSFLPLHFDQIRNIYLLNPGTTAELPKGYELDIDVVRSKHKDLYGKDHCIGSIFNLKYGKNNEKAMFKLGLTSDTGMYFSYDKLDGKFAFESLSSKFNKCDMVVAHIGSILKSEFDWLKYVKYVNNDDELKSYLYKTHLGILGLTKLINDIANETLKLVVISEYGEEMKKIRTDITQILNVEFNNKPVFRSGDIGLKVFIPDLKIVVENEPKGVIPKLVDEIPDSNYEEIKYKKKII